MRRGGPALIRWTLGLAAALPLVGVPAQGLAAATGWVGDAHAASRLVTSVQATGSASVVDAGLEIRMAPGWHTYWRDPGDAGLSPTVDWKGSTNLAREGNRVRARWALHGQIALHRSLPRPRPRTPAARVAGFSAVPQAACEDCYLLVVGSRAWT